MELIIVLFHYEWILFIELDVDSCYGERKYFCFKKMIFVSLALGQFSSLKLVKGTERNKFSSRRFHFGFSAG